MAIVYQHRRKDTNEIFYIGIGNSKKRAYSKHRRGKFWKDYTSKHDYFVEITHSDIIREEACSIEKYLIAFWGRRDLGLGPLVNETDGGEGTSGRKYKHKESTKKKISQRKKGIPNSEETRKKMSEAKKDVPLTDEHKRKLSEIMSGRPAHNRKRLEIIFIDGTIKIFESLKDAAKHLGINKQMIKRLSLGEYQHKRFPGLIINYI
jgi:hypothetical protein